MFFVRVGSLLAWLLFLFGCWRVGFAFIIATAFETPEAMVAASKRYLGADNTGEVIDKGLLFIVSGIVLGVLVEIAKGGR